MKKQLSRRQRRYLGGYLRKIADSVGLRDWTFELIGKNDADEGGFTCIASCRTTPGRRFATLMFGPTFLRESPESQRHVCVHELLHCHLLPFTHYLRATIEGVAGRKVATATLEAWRVHHETAVDSFAEMVEERFPLPEMPKR